MRAVSQVQTEPWNSVETVTSHLDATGDSVHLWIDAKHREAPRIGKLWKFRLAKVDDGMRADEISDAQTQEKPLHRQPMKKRK